MDVPRLYRAAFTLVGFSMAANSLDSVLTTGLAVVDVVVLVAGTGIGLSMVFARGDPTKHGIPTEPGLRFYVVLVAALLSVAGLVFTFV